MSKSRDRIHVLHLLPTLEVGGAESLVVDLILKQQRSERVVPGLACLWDKMSLAFRLDDAGITPSAIWGKSNSKIGMFVSLVRQIARTKPELIHTHLLEAHIYGSIAARMTGIPVVHTKHGRAVRSMAGFPRLRKWIYSLSDRIVAVSGETADNFISLSGVEPDIVEVIHNGVDVSAFSRASRDSARQILGIDMETIIFGTVSRLHAVKNHIALIKAFERLASKRSGILLLIVGDGPERQKIEEYLKQLPSGVKVVLTGFRGDVSCLLPGVDLFLLPSLEEGLPLSLLEAAIAGVPIIASDRGGIPEIITGGVTGTLIDPSDDDALFESMEDYMDNPGKFDYMAKKAQESVRRDFSIETMAERYESLYDKVICKGK